MPVIHVQQVQGNIATSAHCRYGSLYPITSGAIKPPCHFANSLHLLSARHTTNLSSSSLRRTTTHRLSALIKDHCYGNSQALTMHSLSSGLSALACSAPPEQPSKQRRKRCKPPVMQAVSLASASPARCTTQRTQCRCRSRHLDFHLKSGRQRCARVQAVQTMASLTFKAAQQVRNKKANELQQQLLLRAEHVNRQEAPGQHGQVRPNPRSSIPVHVTVATVLQLMNMYGPATPCSAVTCHQLHHTLASAIAKAPAKDK